MYKKFGEYMYSLLFGPLKKIKKKANQLHTFFSVIGKLFDENKQDLFRVREESFIISCSLPILNEFGKERDMPRLEGEAIDNYRYRLMKKNIIAEQAGTNIGIQNALVAAGYKDTYLEPFFLYDPDRWAEFIVYLGENTAGVTSDVASLDREISKIKPASARANYFADRTRNVEIESKHESVDLCYMMCGLQRCGAPVNLY